MKGFIGNIEDRTGHNTDFRRVLYTGPHLQLVLMSLDPGEEIGEEIHETTDQFFRVEEGEGEAVIDGRVMPVVSGAGLLIPARARHNIRNTGREPLKVYTLYAPPHHEDGTVHRTRAEAETSTEHFAGKTTE
jgi:mannose-6-phosphate isomerase-like protein (cupin superfamily)